VHTRLALLVITVLFAAGAAACSSEGDDDPGDHAGSTTTAEDDRAATTGGDEGEPPGTAGEEGEPGEAAGGEEAPPEDSLGTATGRVRADPNDATAVPLRLDVVALDRLDGMVELRLVLTHEGRGDDPPFAPYDAFRDPRLRGDDGRHSLSGARLVDADAERAYLTLLDSDGVCLCTGDLDALSLAPGDSVELYADFGGVPDDLDQVSVQVPGFRTVNAVPIGG